MQILRDGKSVNLPDFIIVGAAKSATTSLYYYLKKSTDIYLPSIKEPWFFSFRNELPPLIQPNYPDGIDATGVHVFKDNEYFDLFSAALDGQSIGEASTSYLYLAEKTIRNIQSIYGDKYKDVKIIIVLRNPIERAWSHYMMHVRDGIADDELLDSIKKDVVNDRIAKGWTIAYDYIGQGMYSDRVNAFLNEFRKVKVILFDDIEINPDGVMKELFSFLEVNASHQIDTRQRYNVSGVAEKTGSRWLAKFIFRKSALKANTRWILPKKTRQGIKRFLSGALLERKKMNLQIRAELTHIYRQDIMRLEKLLGKNLSQWK